MFKLFQCYPRIAYFRIFKIAAPLILINATQVVMQLCDRKFLSLLGSEHLAAALPGGVLAYTMGSFFFVTTAFSVPMIAQHFGKKEYKVCARIPWTAFWYALAAGLLCSLVISPLGENVIHLFSRAQPDLACLMLDYYRTLMPGIGCSLIMVAFCSFFSGRGITWVPAIIQVAMCLLNIFFNWVFIFGECGVPRMEMAGAGIGTTLANICGMLFATAFFLFFAPQKYYPTRKLRFPKWFDLKRLLKFGSAAGFQVFSEVGAFTVVTFIIGKMGVVAAATCTVAMSLNLISFMPLTGISEATCIVTGQAIGRRRIQQAENTPYQSWQVAWIYLLIVGIVYIFFPEPLINFFKPEDPAQLARFGEIVEQGRIVLFCVALFSFSDAVVFVFTGAMRGAGDTTVPMIIYSSMHWLLWVPLTYLMVEMRAPTTVLWGYLVVHMALIATMMYLRFRSGAWKKMKVLHAETVR